MTEGFSYRRDALAHAAGRMDSAAAELRDALHEFRAAMAGDPCGDDEQGRVFEEGRRAAVDFLLGDGGGDGGLGELAQAVGGAASWLRLIDGNVAEAETAAAELLRRGHTPDG